MSTSSDQLIRPLTLKFVFALALLGLLAVTNFVLLKTEIVSSESMTSILNSSNQQRLLLQRTLWLSAQLVTTSDPPDRFRLRQELTSAIVQLEKAHFDLMPYDSWATTVAEPIRSIYDDVPWLLDSEMRNYILHLRALTTAPDEELGADNVHFEYLQNPDTIEKLTGGLDAVVGVYARHSAAKTTHVRLLAVWSLVSTLVVLLLDGWFIFRPMVQRVRADVEQLNTLNATLDRRVAQRTAESVQRAEELARSESALRDSNALYRSLVSNLPMCVLRKDTTGHFTFANDRFCQLVDLPLDEIIGRMDMDLYPRDMAEKYRADDETVMATEHVLQDVERHRTPAGRELFVEVIKTALHDAEDNIIGTQTVFWDVTDRRLAEERAHRAERLAAIGQMVTGVAHESRNALQQIQACSRMLDWELDGDETQRELIMDIQAAEDRLRRLFNDLRGYASPMHPRASLCRISRLLDRAWESIRPLHERRTTSLEIISHDEHVEWEADSFQLEQVFRNLLENSLAACDDPVEIKVDYYVAEVEGTTILHIIIGDNGPGLSPDQEMRIFEPFFTTKTHGTGLGMAIVKQIINVHGGSVVARCGIIGGTQIEITLPRSEQGVSEFDRSMEICNV